MQKFISVRLGLAKAHIAFIFRNKNILLIVNGAVFYSLSSKHFIIYLIIYFSVDLLFLLLLYNKKTKSQQLVAVLNFCFHIWAVFYSANTNQSVIRDLVTMWSDAFVARRFFFEIEGNICHPLFIRSVNNKLLIINYK